MIQIKIKRSFTLKLQNRAAKKIFLTAVVLGICWQCCTQMSLKIGDKVPDVVLTQVINYPGDNIQLSEFKGQLIILDLWGTGCMSCIEGFPKIDQMQAKFKNRVQFIAVNEQSRDSTLRFFEKRKKVIMPAVPFVTQDTIINRLFPTSFNPVHVWIDSNLIVRHITSAGYANQEIIEGFLSGKQIDFVEIDHTQEFSLIASISDTENRSSLLYYSAISPWNPGQRGEHTAFKDSAGAPLTRIVERMTDILNLYRTAIAKGSNSKFRLRNTFVLEVKDTSRYIPPKEATARYKWEVDNFYNYELRVPPAKTDQLYDIMLQDLTRFFDNDVRVEKRKVPCIVLEALPGAAKKLLTKGAARKSNFHKETDEEFRYLVNYPIERLASQFTTLFAVNRLPTPFINATNLHLNIDIQLSRESLDVLDFNLLNKELATYGLRLVQKNWTVDVLIIRDKPL